VTAITTATKPSPEIKMSKDQESITRAIRTLTYRYNDEIGRKADMHHLW
jgi:hypothetical protein